MVSDAAEGWDGSQPLRLVEPDAAAGSAAGPGATDYLVNRPIPSYKRLADYL